MPRISLPREAGEGGGGGGPATSPLGPRDHAFDLATNRLELRPLRRADRALHDALYRDAETMRFIGPVLAEAEAERAFERSRRRSRAPWRAGLVLSIRDRATRTPLGLCGMPALDPVAARAEVGIMLIPGYADRGYAREAFSAFIDRVFAALPVAEVWVQYPAAHARVFRMMSALGFGPDAARDGRHDGRVVWSVRRERWHPIHRTGGEQP